MSFLVPFLHPKKHKKKNKSINILAIVDTSTKYAQVITKKEYQQRLCLNISGALQTRFFKRRTAHMTANLVHKVKILNLI